jgi:hypothetical protein
MDKTLYQTSFERHWTAVLGMLRYLITQFADESVEVAARAVALAAPLPNAINMYNVGIGQLGWSAPASFAFSLTLEIVVFLLVEIALLMWDGYLRNPKRYTMPLAVSVGIVLVSVAVVMTIVYQLETHKIMALLPVVSLCSFVGIGLKRWNERNESHVQTAIVPEVQAVNDGTIDRRKQVATHYLNNPMDSYQAAADALGITSKTTVYNDVKWLERNGVVHVERNGKTTNVTVNGQYETFMNG